MAELLSSKNSTTGILVLLNLLHAAFSSSEKTEEELVHGIVDVAFEDLRNMERAVNELREKNSSLIILRALDERVGVLRDVLSLETEKIWSRLVVFSEEGDIQLSVLKRYTRILPRHTNSGPSSDPSTAPSNAPPTMTIAAVADLLKSLNLLDETMKSLTSLLSRAFLDHLLQNPVGWQFIYRKHDPVAPSITMKPTNLTLADLTPHGRTLPPPPPSSSPQRILI